MAIKHLGIIPDGNRRYAKKAGIGLLRGHEEGVKRFWDVIGWCREKEVEEVSFYTFSTENFKRPKVEVDFLMGLFRKEFKKLKEEGIFEKDKIRFIGRLSMLPKDVQEMMVDIVEETKDNEGLKVNFCIAYGGRSEIVDVVKSLLKDGVKASNLDESVFADRLYLNSDVDLVIRTSEKRLSNFLIWQAAYSEVIFLDDILWPEITKEKFFSCLDEFEERKRRYGG